MLVFIIPVKSKAIANSWEILSKLVERCVKSACNQTPPNFSVVVVCNERPNIQFQNPHVYYVEVDFPVPIYQETEEERLKGYDYALSSKEIALKNADKARKILIGINFSQQFQPSHIMVVDSDDCVSKHLAEYVVQHQDGDGWVLRKGYIYRENSKFVYMNTKNFNQVTGSSVIIKYALHKLLFENPDFYAHSFDLLPGANIQPLPFVGAVYTIENGENILANKQITSQMLNTTLREDIGSLIKKIFKYRLVFLSKSIIDEFGLYPCSVKNEQPVHQRYNLLCL
ncbi:MAG: glycosyltransferase family 2 protein [Microcoleus sp. CAN_BIN18]|nr:glycosyltransferase family 2 protein [Microcoleus sp. CAN_BIN18]